MINNYRVPANIIEEKHWEYVNLTFMESCVVTALVITKSATKFEVGIYMVLRSNIIHIYCALTTSLCTIQTVTRDLAEHRDA